jgi:hypothetical protein
MTGLANHLMNQFDYPPEQIKYGGTDSFWNKKRLERLALPGLVYGASSLEFPRGMSAHLGKVSGDTNKSATTAMSLSPVACKVTLTLGMLALDEEQHFDQIHKYVQMAVQAAELRYRVILPDFSSSEEVWVSSIGDFSELSPPPGGREFDTFDPEGTLYPIEATFSLNTSFLFSQEKKLIRAIFVDTAVKGVKDSINKIARIHDVEGKVTVETNNTDGRLQWETIRQNL